MSKSIKFLVAISGLIVLHSIPVSANNLPHTVPALNCPEGQTCCPTEVYCSYTEGCGDTGNWYADGQALSRFEGVKQFKLISIQASISMPKEKTYWYYCNYQNTETGGYLDLVDGNYKLNGNWQYSGFDNYNARCKSTNPLDCTATKVTYEANTVKLSNKSRLFNRYL